MSELGSHDPKELKRFEKKYKAVRRAEFRLKQRLDTIDWELDILERDYAAQIKAVVEVGELPELSIVDERRAGSDS